MGFSKVDQLKIVLTFIASSWQNQHRKHPGKTPRNLLLSLYLPWQIGNRTLFFFYSDFVSFTAQFVRESYHLRFNRQTPQKAVLCHVLAAFCIVVVLHYELISSLWDDGTHLPFTSHHCPYAAQPRRTSELTCTHVRAHLLRLPLSLWPHSRLTWLMGFHPCSAASKSLLISCVYPLGALPRARYGRVTLLDDRPTSSQAVASQTRWLVSTKHIRAELSHFTSGFYFGAIAFPVNPTTTNASLYFSRSIWI